MLWLPRHAPPTLSLALQGGGAHGAFTWGVLDTLLAETDWPLDAISGTSAGALNAVALAHGWTAGEHGGGRAGARAALDRLWTAVGTQLPFEYLTAGSAEQPTLAPAAQFAMSWMHAFSPYQFNPLGLNPLRELLGGQIDFAALRAHGRIRLYIAATHANSGRLRLFESHELTLDALLASACLPALHHAVEIDGEPYWDGGYSANPALFPLVRGGARDLLAVTLMPSAYAQAPRTAQEIRERALEFAFGAPFLRESTLLGETIARARESRWPHGRLERRLRALRTHWIDGDGDLAHLAPQTRLIAHLPFLQRLRERGAARAGEWLRRHRASVGQRSTADYAAGAPNAAAAAPTSA